LRPNITRASKYPMNAQAIMLPVPRESSQSISCLYFYGSSATSTRATRRHTKTYSGPYSSTVSCTAPCSHRGCNTLMFYLCSSELPCLEVGFCQLAVKDSPRRSSQAFSVKRSAMRWQTPPSESKVQTSPTTVTPQTKRPSAADT
jgi:hypothetical protein